MTLKPFLGATAVALTVGMLSAVPASAITLTGEADSATITDENNVVVADTALVLAPNPASLSLGPIPAEFLLNVLVSDDGTSTGFTAVQEFVNDSGADQILKFGTINLPSEFVGGDLQVSVDGGAFLSVGLAEALIDVTAGSTFAVKALASDVLKTAQFDVSIQAVPLPASALLLLGGLGALGGLGFARRRSAPAAA